MNNINYIILDLLKYIIIFELIINIKKCKCQYDNIEENLTKFTLEAYDDDGNKNSYSLEYNYKTNIYDKNDILLDLPNVKYAIICNDEDIEIKDKKILLFWNTSTSIQFRKSLPYVNAFPLWSDNAYAEICNENNKSVQCPDLIVIGTTQVSYRYKNNDTTNLNKYINNYYINHGTSLESRLNKYLYKDYHIDNRWVAIPVIVDFRVMRFNITTFDYCNKKYEYNLHYPPPLSDYWENNPNDIWNFDKLFEYAEKITKCTGIPGFRLDNNGHEILKFFVSYCQSNNIPVITENEELDIKQCGFKSKEYISKLNSLKKFIENKNYNNNPISLMENEVRDVNGFLYGSPYNS
eukprot:jgi/Orpsp1_1/1174792/evm.model.c7180000051437.1